jgi:hypothetical protein
VPKRTHTQGSKRNTKEDGLHQVNYRYNLAKTWDQRIDKMKQAYNNQFLPNTKEKQRLTKDPPHGK